MSDPDAIRRGLVFGVAATGMLGAGSALGQTSAGVATETDTAAKELNGQPMPEPSGAQSAGPVAPGRGSNLAGKVAVVTGAARGIGRAITVEFAANGADVVALDIAGPVSPASNAVPATPEELDETVRQIKAYGRRGEAVRADIRDIAALRQVADTVEQTLWQDRHRRGGRGDPEMEGASGDGGLGLARRDRQQSERRRQHDPRLRAENGRAKERADHRALLDARQARHQGRRELLRLEVGHLGPYEVGGDGARPAQHHGQCNHSRARRYGAHSL